MRKNLSAMGLLLAGTLIMLSACKKNEYHPTNKTTGYLYTSINGEGENRIVRFSRAEDGSLSAEKSWPTGTNGGANVGAGGDAHGDFDAQGAVQLIDNWLLAGNAGGNQVSVFAVDHASGDLSFKSNTASGGTRPVSIAFTRKANTNNEYWVVVANQWNNPNVQKDGAKIERYPNNAFFQTDLTKPDASDAQRNISLFTFNAATGALSPDKLLDTYNRENG
ncbi:MAG: beta-propeller fold lactonase family protein, partial [Chitinophagaceae bacterium]